MLRPEEVTVPPMRSLVVAGSLLGALGGLLFSARAHAFDYEEHKYVSNVGFRIAVDAAGAQCPKSELLELVSTNAIGKNRSFGDLVGLVDYLHGVEEVLVRQGESDSLLKSFDDIDWQHLEEEKGDSLRFLQAAHGNESHFQLNALMAHWNHHKDAVLLARDGLFHALVLEAYGLHFLEDFHAPGHVATTRGVLPDYVSIAVHEKFNAAGLDFKIMDEDGELRRLAEIAMSLDMRDLQLAQQDVPDKLPLSAADFKGLQSALAGGSQRFLGDSLLRRNKIQAAYLAILVARSVGEVLAAGCPATSGAVAEGSAGRTGFKPLWCLGFYSKASTCGRGASGKKGPLFRAETSFGKYGDKNNNFLGFVFKPADVLLFSYYNEFSQARGIQGHAGSSELVVESLLMSFLPSKFVHVDEDAPYKPALQRFGFFAPSLLYGFAHTTGDNNSYGYHARLLLAIPRIDLQASVSYGIRYYAIGGRTTRAYPLGYGLEAGFGFLLLHLGINDEFTRSPVTGDLKARRLIRGGMTFVLAKSVYRRPFQKLARLLKRREKKEPVHGAQG
jgi:hypothetical protein